MIELVERDSAHTAIAAEVDFANLVATIDVEESRRTPTRLSRRSYDATTDHALDLGERLLQFRIDSELCCERQG